MFGSVLGRAQGQTPPGNAARTAVGCRALVGGVLQHLADRPAVPAAVFPSCGTAFGTPTARGPPPGGGVSPHPLAELAGPPRLLPDGPLMRGGRPIFYLGGVG